MAAKNKGGRLVSSAGLVTYYDSDDRRAIHLNPKYVLVVAVAVGVITMLLNAFI